MKGKDKDKKSSSGPKQATLFGMLPKAEKAAKPAKKPVPEPEPIPYEQETQTDDITMSDATSLGMQETQQETQETQEETQLQTQEEPGSPVRAYSPEWEGTQITEDGEASSLAIVSEA
jgi:chromosome transmission fidelity protein 4